MIDAKDFHIVLISFFNLDFGIRYISSLLKNKGYPVYLINFNQLRYPAGFVSNDFFTGSYFKQEFCADDDIECLMGLLEKLKPRLVGISVTSAMMEAAKIITFNIKQRMDVPICWGGIHAIIAPEECIQFVDLVCIGEGEWVFLETAERMREGNHLQNIDGLWVKENEIVNKSKHRTLIQDLDSLPFPDFIEEGNKFTIHRGMIIKDPPLMSGALSNTYPVITSRGCMFNCSFCCNSIIRKKISSNGNYLRRRSVDNVLQELKMAVRNKPIARIKFWDDIFTYDKDWISEFCARYLDEIGKPFFCYAHPKFTDRQIFAKLANAGMILTIIGIQSGNEMINKEIFNRWQLNNEIYDFSKFIKKIRVTLRYVMILDNPYEGDIELNNTVEFLLGLPRPYQIQFNSLCHFPKTPLTERALADKIIRKCDIEQYSRKTLNNFYLYLPLSINNRSFFWNCICALVVNEHFPRWFVHLCRRSIFLKNKPKVLFILSRYYLKLLKLIFKFTIAESIVITTTPALVNDVWSVTPNNDAFLFHKNRLSLLLHLSVDNKHTRKFMLRIINHDRIKVTAHLVFNISPLFSDKAQDIALWKADIYLSGSYETVVRLDLTSFPDLYIRLEDESQKARLLKYTNVRRISSKLYIFRVSSFFSSEQASIDKQVTQVLMTI